MCFALADDDMGAGRTRCTERKSFHRASPLILRVVSNGFLGLGVAQTIGGASAGFMNPTPKHRRLARPGFTLIELLTVIAIIGILAAIIIPTVGRVRQSAQQAKCVSNLRQLGTAALMWHEDNPRSKLTPQLQRPLGAGTENISWIAALLPYLNTKVAGYDSYGSAPDLTHCGATRPASNWQRNSFGINALTNDPNWPRGLSRVREPARTILAGDVNGTTLDETVSNSYQVLNPTGYNDTDVNGQRRFSTRHAGGAKGNVVFFDAHVEAITREQYDWNTVGGFSTRAPQNPWKIW
jgi:general secretion pathway protein G